MSSPDAPPREYPPPEHILRDLQLEMETGPENYFCSRMPVVPEILTADGRVEASVLATLADLAGATVTFQFLLPDWMATADLAVHLLEAPIGTTLVARPRILRAGRRTIITEVAIEDEGGSSTRPVGHATLTFARIERPDLTLHLNPEDAPTERQRKSFGTPGGGLHTGHREQTGIRIIDAERGICILDRTDYTLNSFGTLQGGSVAALAESAAESLIIAKGRTPVTEDLTIRYLAKGPQGPYRSEATLLRCREDEALARVEVHDTGEDKLMSVADIRLRLI
jgi:acyl-coenzyme A thioesterase PaaI-like protein